MKFITKASASCDCAACEMVVDFAQILKQILRDQQQLFGLLKAVALLLFLAYVSLWLVGIWLCWVAISYRELLQRREGFQGLLRSVAGFFQNPSLHEQLVEGTMQAVVLFCLGMISCLLHSLSIVEALDGRGWMWAGGGFAAALSLGLAANNTLYFLYLAWVGPSMISLVIHCEKIVSEALN